MGYTIIKVGIVVVKVLMNFKAKKQRKMAPDIFLFCSSITTLQKPPSESLRTERKLMNQH